MRNSHGRDSARSPEPLRSACCSQTRAATGTPAYLSSPSNCAYTAPLLVSKDYGTGRQRWRVAKLA